MKYLSVCSGIEAATVAWHPLGWTPVAFSEIEPFPSSVLAHHYPSVPNLGDMTKFKDWNIDAIDLLVGGTPCQSFSVAGLRKGLDDPRGNLMLTFGAIAAKYRPKWLVWENVPGVLSSNGGRDFGAFLGMLGELWYGFAYRVLDAQYFGVPQRRRRVFVVGCLGDWRSAAAVLFERHSVSGHPAPRRQAGQRPTGTLSARTEGGGGLGTDFELGGGLQVAGTMKACKDSGGWSNSADHAAAGYMVPVATLCVATGQAGAEIGADMAPTLNYNHEAPYIAHSLRGEGFDASEDGTGRGTPLVPMSVALRGREGGATAELGDDLAFALRASSGGGDKPHVIAPKINACAEHKSEENKGFNKTELNHACTQETNTIALLRRVREAIGTQAFAQWGLGILDSLQSPEILRSALHGSELRPATFSRRWVVCCALGIPLSRSAGAMQSLREAAGEGCTSQGWGFSEQHFEQLGTYLSELSQPGAQAERLMSDLWQAAEGLGLLRDALSAIQKARRPAGDQRQSVRPDSTGGRAASAEGMPSAGMSWEISRERILQQARTATEEGDIRKSEFDKNGIHGKSMGNPALAVRRLVVEECEFLQGFPRGYTAVPHRGKTAADGPRYKALGNSMAVPCMAWIGSRIQMVESIAQESAKYAQEVLA